MKKWLMAAVVAMAAGGVQAQGWLGFLGRPLSSADVVRISASVVVTGSVNNAEASNISARVTSAYAATSTIPVSALANALGLPNGKTTMTVDNDGRMVFTVVTNAFQMFVAATNGAPNYNGPAPGTLFLYDGTNTNPERFEWYTAPLAWYAHSITNNGDENVLFQDDYTEPTLSWSTVTVPGTAAPDSLELFPATTGEFTLAWITVTNTYAYYPMGAGYTTNHTVAAGDVLHFTNGLLRGVTVAP